MNEHYDLPGARKALGDAVHALAGRTYRHLDRDTDTLERDDLDRRHQKACAAIDQTRDDALIAMRRQARTAHLAGQPWTLERTQAETERIHTRHRDAMAGLQIRYQEAVVSVTTSIVHGRSLLAQLRTFTSAKTGQGKGKPGSMVPVQVDALDLLERIDRQAAVWCMEPGTTADRLHSLADRQYRPEDAPDILECASTIEGWVVEARQIIDPPRRMSVAAPCPECGKSVVYRPDSGGDVVRQPALQIGADGCQCQHCRTMWHPESYRLLAKVLQIPDPEGVIDVG